MLALKDIEDALLTDARVNISGVKTVETHEKEFDDMLLTNLAPRAPFVLVRYGGTNPNDSERRADGSSGISGREFHLVIGAESFRSKKEGQRAAYDILDDLRERYNGFNLSVSGSSITLAYDGDSFWFSSPGLVVYKLFLKWDEN